MGARPGATEILSITWERVNFETGTVLVESAHKGGPEWRAVPIHPGIMSDLKKWHKDDNKTGHVVHYNGHRIKSIRSAWYSALKKAGANRNIRPYDLRHHFVSATLAAGHDIKSVAEVVGSSPNTLMRFYQHVSDEQHRATVASIPTLDDA